MDDAIELFMVGPIQTNCYAYESASECMVVDPGGEGAMLADALSGFKVVAIVCTHGHGDHVGGVAALKAATGAPYLIHAADSEAAQHSSQVPEWGICYDDDAPEPDGLLSEGDVISVGTARFSVMETPGHTPGCVCLVGSGSAEGVVFSGDTLFAGSRGRTDLPGGDTATIMDSLARLKREVPPEAAVYPGHGLSTTMARELAVNPYLR